MRELARPITIVGEVAFIKTPDRHSRSLSPAAPHGRSNPKPNLREAAFVPSSIYRCASDRDRSTKGLFVHARTHGKCAAVLKETEDKQQSQKNAMYQLIKILSQGVAKLERKDSISGRYGTTIPLLPGLTPSQVLTIRRSWKHVNTKGLQEVIRRCFQKSERSNSSVLSAFIAYSSSSGQSLNVNNHQSSSCSSGGPLSPTTTSNVRGLMDHTRYFLTLLDRIIETDQEVDLELKRVGAKHVILYERFGVGVPELERLGEIFAEAFFKLDGIRASKETTKAWRILISKIIDHIRDGFETELRYQKRRTSFQPPNGDSPDSRFWKRNSMPSSRKTSKLLEIAQITRKLSNF